MTMNSNLIEVKGILKSQNGLPMADHVLEFISVNPPSSDKQIVTTDKDGLYSIHLHSGIYKLEIIEKIYTGCNSVHYKSLSDSFIAISDNTISPSSIDDLKTDSDSCNLNRDLERDYLDSMKKDIELIHHDFMSKDFVPDVDCKADKNAIYGRKGDRSGWEIIGNGTVLDTNDKKPQVRVSGGWKPAEDLFTPKVDTSKDGRFVMDVTNGVAKWDVFYNITWADIFGKIDQSQHWSPIAKAINDEIKNISAWVQNNFETKINSANNSAHSKTADIASDLESAAVNAIVDQARSGMVKSVGGVKPDGLGDVRLTWADIAGDPKQSASYHVIHDEIKKALADAEKKTKLDLSSIFLGIADKAVSAKVADKALIADTLGNKERSDIIIEARKDVVTSVNGLQPNVHGDVQITLPVVEVGEVIDNDFYVRQQGQWIRADTVYQRSADAIDNAKVADVANELSKKAKDQIIADAKVGTINTIVVDGVDTPISKNGMVVINSAILDVVTDKPHVRGHGYWGEFIAGSGIDITRKGNDYEIKSIAKSTVTDGENVGTGQAVFQALDGDKLKFRKIHGEGDLLVEDDGDSIKISHTGAGFGGGVPDVKNVGAFLRNLDSNGTHTWVEAETIFAKKSDPIKDSLNAIYAKKAGRAANADNATLADEAKLAQMANIANHANKADLALKADRALVANKADVADSLNGLTKAQIISTYIPDAPDSAKYVREKGAWIKADFLPVDGKADSAIIADNAKKFSNLTIKEVIDQAQLGLVKSINGTKLPDFKGNIDIKSGIEDVLDADKYVRTKGGWIKADYIKKGDVVDKAKIADDIPESLKAAIAGRVKAKDINGIVVSVNGKLPINGNIDLTGKGGSIIVDVKDSANYVRSMGAWHNADDLYLKKTDAVTTLDPAIIDQIIIDAGKKAPVIAVNGKTGLVDLKASDVKAAPELTNGINGSQYALSADGQTWLPVDTTPNIAPNTYVTIKGTKTQEIESPLATKKLIVPSSVIGGVDGVISNGLNGLNLDANKKLTISSYGNVGATVDIDDHGNVDFWFSPNKHKPTHGDDSVLTAKTAIKRGFIDGKSSVTSPNKTFVIKGGKLIESEEIKEPSREGWFIRRNENGVNDWIDIKDKFAVKSDIDKSLVGTVKSVNGYKPDPNGNVSIPVGTGSGTTVAGIEDVKNDKDKPHVRTSGKWVLLPESIDKTEADKLYLGKGDRSGIILDARKDLATEASIESKFVTKADADKSYAEKPVFPANAGIKKFGLTNGGGWMPITAIEKINNVPVSHANGGIEFFSSDKSIKITPIPAVNKINIEAVGGGNSAPPQKLVDHNGDDALEASNIDIVIKGDRILKLNDVDLAVVNGAQRDVQIGHSNHGLRLHGKGDLTYNGVVIGAASGGASSSSWDKITGKPNVTIDTENIKQGAMFRTYNAISKKYEWSESIEIDLGVIK